MAWRERRGSEGRCVLGAMLVRDAAFFEALSREIDEWSPRLIRAYLRSVEADRMERARVRERVDAAETVVELYLRMMREMGWRVEPFVRMVKGETLRQVLRKSPGRATFSVMDDLAACTEYLEKTDISGSLKVFVDSRQ